MMVIIRFFKSVLHFEYLNLEAKHLLDIVHH